MVIFLFPLFEIKAKRLIKIFLISTRINCCLDKSDVARSLTGEWRSGEKHFTCSRTSYSELRCDGNLIQTLDGLNVTHQKRNKVSKITGKIGKRGKEIIWSRDKRREKIGKNILITNKYIIRKCIDML